MTTELGSPFDIVQPRRGSVPVVLSSPHSGQIYPPCLLRDVRLNLSQLRRLEDAFVDRLFDTAPYLGAPLLHARFARAFVDANREAYEFDAALFDEPLPAHVNPNSAKAKAGLGTIPSRIGGKAIYRSKLSMDEAERRIRLAYWPYHHALQGLIDECRTRFGQVLLLDCHSMPSFSANGVLTNGSADNEASGRDVIDFALGDRFGCSCGSSIIHRAEIILRRRGFKVARNRPYAGGYI
ncbi:MAG: N-formylglutamate amidohydrolase, partial [Geminicoccaceae bacterium]